MLNKLYVFANMGHLNELPKSGGQSSARRVMKGLQESGFEIIPIRRHRAELEGKWKHQLEIMAFAVIDLLKIVVKMLFGKRRNAAFLHLTYAGPLVPYELLLTYIVKFMGYKNLIYLKGGQVLDYYANGSKLHRKMFKKTIDMQSKVFFEGMESLELVKKISITPLVYFPNYVFNEQIPEKYPNKPKDRINILYFGRIAPNKNVHIILETFNLLCHHRNNVYLTIIGGTGQSKAYVDKIDHLIIESPYHDKILRMGNTPFETIREIMSTQHFFLFPSKERAEGHSNSLNEAMSYGLIPVVSNYHFNRSVVGDDRFVVEGYSAQNYVKAIDNIINNMDMDELSIKIYNRVCNLFAYSIVNPKVCNSIKNI